MWSPPLITAMIILSRIRKRRFDGSNEIKSIRVQPAENDLKALNCDNIKMFNIFNGDKLQNYFKLKDEHKQ